VDAPSAELREAREHYHAQRAQRTIAPGLATPRGLAQAITRDAYDVAKVFPTRPQQVIAGSLAAASG
jgi:hypothetical protein